jgi:O-antigen/teichoic acid export membrane protein
MFLSTFHYRVDLFILASMKSMSVVGTYALSARLLDMTLAGFGVFSGLVFPILVRRRQQDIGAFTRTYRRAFDVILGLGTLAAVVIFATAPYIAQVFGGGTLPGAVAPLAIMAWAVPVTALNTLFAYLVFVANRQVRAIPVVIAAIVLNVALNVALIPRLGAVAPAIATDITESLGACGIAILALQHFKLHVHWNSVIRVAASTLVAICFWLAFRPQGTKLVAAITPVAYLICLCVLGAFRIEVLRSLLDVGRSARRPE